MRVKIKVSDLQVGQVFPSPLYMDETNILIPANTPIKQSDIDRLLRWKIHDIEIDDTPNNTGQNSDEKSSGSTISNATNNENQKEEKQGVSSSLEKRKAMLAKTLKNYSSEIASIEKKVNSQKPDKDDTAITILKNFINLTDRLRNLFFEIRIDRIISQNAVDNLVSDVMNLVKTKKYEILSLIYNYNDDQIDYLVMHSINVAIYSTVIGYAMELANFKIAQLVKGALFHDVGMLKIPEELLKKEGKLTDQEFTLIKSHPVIGYKLLNQKQSFVSEIAKMALEHHERYNGSGYPSGMKGEDISLYSRIVAIADSYDAMTQTRSYKTKYMSHIAIKNVLYASKNLYDPNILRTFLSVMSIYPIGSLVQLNNGVIGVIMRSNPKLPLRPVVKVMMDEFGDKVAEKYEIDLEESNSLFITSTLDPKENKIDINEFL